MEIFIAFLLGCIIGMFVMALGNSITMKDYQQQISDLYDRLARKGLKSSRIKK